MQSKEIIRQLTGKKINYPLNLQRSKYISAQTRGDYSKITGASD